jgi:hypothetical protein
MFQDLVIMLWMGAAIELGFVVVFESLFTSMG